MDIAQIGFSVNTTDLEKGTVSLNKLKAAAAGVSGVSDKVARATYLVAKQNADAAQSALSNMKATEGVTKEQLKQAREALKVATAEKQRAKAMLDSAYAAKSLERAQKGLSTASVVVSKRSSAAAKILSSPESSAVTATPTIANDQMPNRFNTANIAAQFQDIGVTASMGMNPMVIALQQGTQLSAIINSMESPLKGIAEAFRSIINPISLIAIIVTGLVATLVQFTDWTAVAQKSLNVLAGAMNFLAENIDVLAVALTVGSTMLAVVYRGAILAAIESTIKFAGTIVATTVSMTASFLSAIGRIIVMLVTLEVASMKAAFTMAKSWILANPLTVFIAAFAAITAALIIFRDNISNVFGVDIVKFAKDGLNIVIGAFVGGFAYIGQIGKNLWQMIKGDMELTFSGITAGASDAFKSALNTDYVGAAANGIKAAGSALKDFAAGMGTTLPAEATKGGKAINDNMKKSEEAVYAYKDALDFTRDTAKGFFQDIRNGLKEGESLWKTFGNAVVNVLNKIFDKMLEAGVNNLFSSIGNPTGGTMGTILGSIQNFLFSAKGNAFTSSGVQKFAKGSAFTNGIYSSPTMFKFGNGGSFGVMGEAGPEAVMPLHRGSDGSLGVKMSGGAANSNVIVNINNYGNSQTSVSQRQTPNGLEIDVMIDEAVSKKIGEQGTATNRALNAYNSRQLIKR